MADWKYNPYVALALLLVIIVIIAYQLAIRPPPDEMYTAVLICMSDKHDHELYVFEAEINVNDEAPYLCPECGEKTAYSALKCYDCGKISPIINKEIHCKRCNSNHVKPIDKIEEIGEENY